MRSITDKRSKRELRHSDLVRDRPRVWSGLKPLGFDTEQQRAGRLSVMPELIFLLSSS